MPDGKPDLSGNWVRFRGGGAFNPPELKGLTRAQSPPPQVPAPPVDPKSPPIAAFWEMGANIQGGLPLTPWAAELKKQRMKARFVERIRRPTYGTLEIDVTLDDPKAYSKPFTVRVNQQISPDDEIIEFICAENQQFRRRIKID